MHEWLIIFLSLKLLQVAFELYLAGINRKFYSNPAKQKEVISILGLQDNEFTKTIAYTNDKFWFGLTTSILNIFMLVGFLALGGFGYFESLAKHCTALIGTDSPIIEGLAFFGILGLTMMIIGLPFSYYSTFVIEEKHGFNRQSIGTFLGDMAKSLIVSVLLGGTLLAGLLYVIENLDNWWIWAWGLVSGFSILTSWLYPTFLAPLFNKFSPIEDGTLKESINNLAKAVKFKTAGVFVMDASRRSSHGNAYFTGVFGKKRIVLFDTLIKDLNDKEVVSVLAHELGHFKLHHVRWGLIRGLAMTAVMFYLLGVMYPMDLLYEAFAFSGVSSYAALVVFSMWFGPDCRRLEQNVTLYACIK